MLVTAFDRWLTETFAREGHFTMFLVLFEATPTTIEPVGSSYLHVIGDEVGWNDLVALMDESGLGWQSVGVFAGKADAGGPIPDVDAQRRLASLDAAILRDRMTVRRGELFDRQGRRLELTPR